MCGILLAVIPLPRAVRRARPRAATVRACVVLGVAAALAGCASTVQGTAVVGEAPNALVPIDGDSVSLRVEYERTVDEVNDYWTADRQGDAAPFDPIVPGGDRTAGAGDSATGVIVDPTTGPVNPVGPQVAASSAGDQFVASGLAAGTQGRLYMGFSTGDSVCSASVVNSAAGNVVATAAHCVWDMDADVVADYLAFVPADADSGASAPYDIWAVESVVLPEQFAQDANLDPVDRYIVGEGWAYDFAFLVMAPSSSGQEIESVTGGQGIAFGIPAQELVVTGYPTMEPFDGTSQRYCASDDWDPYDYAYYISCDMTPGSSGGGWFTNYDAASGSGYLVATTSFGSPGTLGAAPLGATALSLFTEVGGL